MEGLWDKLKGKEERKITTLVGAKQAKVGEEFLFLGAVEKCKTCKLSNSCTNLEVGRRYRIEKVRKGIKHDCPIHEDGVCVVEVIEPAITAAIEARMAFEGSKIVFVISDCKERTCELYDFCHPLGLKNGDKCTISKVIGNTPVDCKKGIPLKLVEIKR
jgi:hypothetical protein